MPRILFWNTYRKGLEQEVASLCHQYDAEIVILAESAMNSVTFLSIVNTGALRIFTEPPNPSTRLRLFTSLSTASIRLVADIGGIAVRGIAPPVGQDFTLIAVHLPSKTAYKETDLAFHATRLNETIRNAEAKVGHKRTVIVGDFNMNPFEIGLVSSDGLHAVMDRRIARQNSRIVAGRQCDFFYNPMWSRMGPNIQGPPGTYYYRDSTHVAYFWNTFDQVLIRPSLLDFLPDQTICVVSEIAGVPLLTPTGVPNKGLFSDHLPIVFDLHTERMTHAQ